MIDYRRLSDNWHLTVAIVVVGLIVRTFFISFTVDDAYITLRYAENLASGNGLVFNPGERIYGTTTPLLALILAALLKITSQALTIGKLLNILCDALVAGVLVLLVRHLSGKQWIGYLTGLLYALNPVPVKWSALGMETGMYTFFICVALWQYGRHRFRSAYIFAGLASLTRIDGGLVFAILLLADLMYRRRGAIVDAIFGGVPVVLWCMYAWLYFGSPIPQSVIAKAVTYGSVPLLDNLQLIGGKLLFRGGIFTVIAAIVALIGLLRVVLQRGVGRLMLSWWLAYWAFYTLGGAHLHGWYLSPPTWVYTLFVGLGVGVITEIVSRRSFRFAISLRVRRAGIWLTVVFVALTSSYLLLRRHARMEVEIGAFEQQVTRPIGEWLKAHSAPGDTVCLESIGAVGYYSGLYVLDEVGLVSPQVMPLNRNSLRGPNFGDIVEKYRPKYYVWWESWEREWWRARPAKIAWLLSRYEKKAVFTQQGKEGWGIWQRK